MGLRTTQSCTLVYAIVTLLSSMSFAQESQCPIYAPNEPSQIEYLRTAGTASQTMENGVLVWEEVDNGNVPDDQYISVDLNSLGKTYYLRFKDFGYDIPPLSTIDGIRVQIEGQSIGEGDIDESILKLYAPSNNDPIENKAGYPIVGEAWPKDGDGLWKYGYFGDHWNRSWTVEDINSPEFGFVLQLQNYSLDDVTALIDKVEIIVYFTPVYSLCQTDFIAFFTDNDANVENYYWTYPDGLNHIESHNNQHIGHFLIEGLEYGTHQICVRPENVAEECCRSFVYESCELGSISNKVWHDINRNGIQDAGEENLPGISLELFDQSGDFLGTTLTDQNGCYIFDDLPQGVYQISIYCYDAIQTNSDPGSNPAIDSNFDVSFGPCHSGHISLDSGEDNVDVDFGLFLPNSIGDYVWLDKNANGIQDEGEPPFADLNINLATLDGTVVSSTVTDENGYYLFEEVANGQYILMVDVPEGMAVTLLNQGQSDSNSDFTSFGISLMITLDGPSDNYDYDLGLIPLGEIGDYVWLDTNRDGIQDDTENGIVATVQLYSEMDSLLAETTTDESGYYLFSDLYPGTYSIKVVTAEDIYLVSPSLSTTADLDSDFINENFESGDITIDCGAKIYDVDFGLMYKFGCIKGNTYSDQEANNTIEDTDVDLSGVSVSILTCAGDIIGSTETDENGDFKFSELLANEYFLVFGEIEDYTFADNGEFNNINSSIFNGSTSCLNLMAGDTICQIGAYYPLSKLGNLVWLDENRDGIQDSNENSIAGLTFSLFDSNDNFIAEYTSTDENPNYVFCDLIPGSYYVQLNDLPVEYIISPYQAGTDVGIDSDLGSDLTSPTVTLTGGDDNMTLDFGVMYNVSCVEGTVWVDINCNGNYDATDGVIQDVEITLVNCTTGLATNVEWSQETGGFKFQNILMGQYYITSDLPAGYQFTIASNDNAINQSIATGSSSCFDLLPGTTFTINVGIRQLNSIGNLVWFDENRNGVQDAGETGIEGIELTLYNSLGLPAASALSTTGNSNYSFDNIAPGIYYVVLQNVPDHLIASPFQVSGNDETDSDLQLLNGLNQSNVITIGCDDIVNLDFGLMDNVSCVTGVVWVDTNCNGISDTGDDVIQDVEITLHNCDTGLATNVEWSLSLGEFKFQNIIAGNYYITSDLPAGYQFSVSNDSGINNAVVAGSSSCFALLPGTTFTINVGLQPLASIGNLVWLDDNRNGVQDSGESAIEGIELTLYNNEGLPVASQISGSSDSNYLFDNVAPGTYYVVLGGISETLTTAPYQSSGNSATDSDLQFLNGLYQSPVLNVSCTHNLDLDFGLMDNLSCIQGQVFVDNNCNGIFDNGDGTLQDVEITLYDCNTGLATNVEWADENGNYKFPPRVSGDYYITSQLPSGYQFTIAGGDNVINNGVVAGSSSCISTSPGGISIMNVGLKPLPDLGNLVWLDDNRNGIQDAGENPISGVELSLYDGNGNLVASTTSTDDDANYLFTDLTPGNYYIILNNIPSNLGVTTFQNGNPLLDSDLQFINGSYQSIVVTIGAADILDLDFGLVETTACVQGSVWVDNAGDGSFNDNDYGYDGLGITLYNCDDNSVVTNVNTDANGDYKLNGVLPGNYYIVSSLPASFTFGASSDANSIDSQITVGSSACFELNSNETEIADVVIVPLNSLGNYVWLDANSNGIQDAGETGIEGVTVRLFNENNEQVGPARLTDANGFYLFTGLMPGQYYVQISNTPTGYSPTTAGIGDSETDSDLYVQDGLYVSPIVTLNAGVDRLDIDFGLVEDGACATGFAWIDINENGIFDDAEVLIKDVELTLWGCNPALAYQVDWTLETGSIKFNNIAAGSYYVTADLIEGYSFTISGIDSDINNGVVDGSTSCFDINNGDVIEIGVGLVPEPMIASRIAGSVWEDLDANGINNIDEPGVENVNVVLLDEGGNTVSNEMSDASGNYEFRDLASGNYRLRFDAAEEYQVSPIGQGAENEDSDILDSRITEMISLGDEADMDIDAGLYRFANIGNYIWLDTNENGLQDGDESGLANMDIVLMDQDGNMSNQSTNESGVYEFTDLVPGSYFVGVTNFDGYEPADKTMGDDPTLDSDLNEDGLTDVITIVSGESNMNVDLGLRNVGGGSNNDPSTISGFVWEDADGNGLYSNTEDLVGEVVVHLKNAMGETINTKETSSNGTYAFNDVMAGSYTVEFKISDNAQATKTDEGSNELIDSDVTKEDGIIESSIITVQDGNSVSGINAGFFTYGSIGDYVWFDVNNDGRQDGDEVGLNNYIVRLYNEDGEQEMFQVTNYSVATGNPGTYRFSGIAPGNYYVKVDLQFGVDFTMAGVGNIDNDSDLNGTNGPNTTSIIAVRSGEQISHVDVGLLLQPGSVGDFVWSDDNANGVQDDGEAGINDVAISLFDGNSNLISQSVTVDHPNEGTAGYYMFEDVVPGEYYVVFDAPVGLDYTSNNLGGNSTKDSDVTGILQRGATSIFNVSASISSNDIDCGLFKMSRIGDFVWHDENRNGIQDESEVGIPNVDIELYREGTGMIAMTSTNIFGGYEFTHLLEGDYYINVIVPTDYEITSYQMGGDAMMDNDVNTSGLSDMINIGKSDQVMNFDIGLSSISTDENINIYEGTYTVDPEEKDHNYVENGWSADLYPIPSTDIVYLAFDGEEELTGYFELYNVNGQKMNKSSFNINIQNSNTLEIDLSEYQAGTYILNVQTEKQINTYRVQKID